MDTLVLPSYTVAHWKEQFGQVLVQAMACGVPVIGSSHAEIPRVIGDAGMVFPERNVQGLAAALADMIRGRTRREALKIAGRQRVMEFYTNRKIAEQTHRVYLSLLN
jgi:glycosyltransferase involved in cell wall biosynthesis